MAAMVISVTTIVFQCFPRKDCCVAVVGSLITHSLKPGAVTPFVDKYDNLGFIIGEKIQKSIP
jgi:hypothetical protein